jgi:aspartyl/asparaginyl beta-hydroxylase (cupin superfamily)
MASANPIAEADRAMAAGDLGAAARLLEEACGSQPEDASLWIRLAAVHRGSGNAEAALAASEHALAAAPLDFTALVMRASLLERLNRPNAAESWGHALAQKPDGPLPPQMAQAVERGAALHAAWLDAREARLANAAAPFEPRADDEESERIARFRSNCVRRTRHFHSKPTRFHFPGLVEREFHPRRLFPWLDELEAATDALSEELQTVMSAERAELVPYIQYDEHMPLAQWKALNRNPDWTAIHLLQNGDLVEANALHCPRTMELMSRIPQPSIRGASPNAMFSLLAPNTAIPAHVGVSNVRLVCHLPLVVPEGCWFRVGAETRYWKRGEAFVFDDTIEHEALNPTDQLRVVFIFDVWHPDLSAIEREAVAAMIGSEAEPSGL